MNTTISRNVTLADGQLKDDFSGTSLRVWPIQKTDSESSNTASFQPLTPRCVNCSAELTSSNSSKAVSSTNPIYSILYEVFSLQIGLAFEKEFPCCRACSLLVTNARNFFHSFKKRMTVNSKLHPLFNAIDKHMLKFSVNGFDFGLSTSSSASSTANCTITDPDPLAIEPSEVLFPEGDNSHFAPLKKAPIESNNKDLKIVEAFSLKRNNQPTAAKLNQVWLTTPNQFPVARVNKTQVTKPKDQPTSTSTNPCSSTNSLLLPSDAESESTSFQDLFPTSPEPDEEESSLEATNCSTPEDPIVTAAAARVKATWRKIRLSHAARARDVFKTGIECCVPYCNEVFYGAFDVVHMEFDSHMEANHRVFICCEFCVENVYGKDVATTRELFERHQRDMHSQEPVVIDPHSAIVYDLGAQVYTSSCRICKKRFHDLNPNVLNDKKKQHILALHQTTIQCDHCSSVFKGSELTIKSRLRKHIEIHHKYHSQVKCRICERPMDHVTARKRHEFTHFSQSDKDEAVKEDPTIHTSTLCPTCGMVLSGYFISAERLLQTHADRFHSSEKQVVKKEKLKTVYSCDKCDFTSATRKTMTRHEEIHNENGYNKYTCVRCGQGFKVGQGNQYTEHTLICCDEKTRPILCTEPDCLKRFKLKQNLVLHLLGVHRKSAEEARGAVYPGLPVHDWIRKHDRTKPFVSTESLEDDDDPGPPVLTDETLPQIPDPPSASAGKRRRRAVEQAVDAEPDEAAADESSVRRSPRKRKKRRNGC